MRSIGTVRILRLFVPSNAMQWRLSRFIASEVHRFANDNGRPWSPLGAA